MKNSFLAIPLLLIPAGCAQLSVDRATGLSVAAKIIDAATPMSDAEEIALGRDVSANLLARFGHYDDAQTVKYVSLTGKTLARRSGRTNIAYHFAVLDTDEVNAFAAPGGYVFVTKGALKTMRNEAELAAVLAHEIAHVAQRHIAKEMQKANLYGAGADIITLMAKDKTRAAALTRFSTDILFKGYSRKDEEEADDKSAEMLEAAGYDTRAFADFLERLAAKTAEEPRFMLLLKTHPFPKDRAARLKIKTGGRKNESRFAKAVNVR